MATLSAGNAQNADPPVAHAGTAEPSVPSFRPSSKTHRTWQPSHGITFTPPLSDQTWQPSRGISFSRSEPSTPGNISTLPGSTIRKFSTNPTGRLSATPTSLVPASPNPLPYLPASNTKDRLFLSDLDDRDPFDDVDFGELVAGKESRGKRKKEPKPKKESDGLTQDFCGAQDKAVQTTTSTPEAVISCDSPAISKAPSPQVARKKISKPKILKNQPQDDITTPPVGIAGNKLDKSIASSPSPLIQYPYIYDRPERIIPEEYISSPEITRLAQLPKYTNDAISAPTLPENEHADYDITSSGADAGDEALHALYKRSKRTISSYQQIWFALAASLQVIRSAKIRYRPVFCKTELLDLASEIRMMQEELASYSHEVRRVLRQRRQSIRYFQLGDELSFSTETSSHYINMCQAMEPMEQLRLTHSDIARAFVGLRDFYVHRKTNNPITRVRALPRHIRRSFFDVKMSFGDIDDYRDAIFEKYRPGRGPQLAHKVGQSLSQLLIRLKRFRQLEFSQSVIVNPVWSEGVFVSLPLNDLHAALYEYWEFETYKAARRKWIEARARRLLQEKKFSNANHPIYNPAGSGDQNKATSKTMVFFKAAKPGSHSNQDKAPPNSSAVSQAAEPCTNPECVALEADAPSRYLDARIGTPDSEIYMWQQRFRRDLKARSLLRNTSSTRTYCAASTGRLGNSDGQPESFNLTMTKSYLQEEEPASLDDPQKALSSATHPVTSKTSNASGADCPAAAVALSAYSSHSPKGYSMNQEAQRSDDTTPQKPGYWSYALYTGPGNEKVRVHYCKNKSDTERIAQMFLGQKVLGFDIEWKPNAQVKDGVKKNVSLIQLASEERVALFHIARYPDSLSTDSFVAPTLKVIMESQDITKVGVAIKGDCTRLRRFMGIKSRGLFELSHLYKLVKFSDNNASNVNKLLVRLATQVEEHLGLPLSKGNARMSDWSLDLNLEQVQYAASDSYAGFQLFHTLEHKRTLLSPTPPRPYHAELNLPIRLATGQSVETINEPNSVEEEEESEIPEPGTTPAVEELARDFMKIAMACPVLPPAKTTMRSPRPGTPQCKAEVIAANEWVAQWRTTLAQDYKPTATPASLRAYALWHRQAFSVPEAAGLLREPPLLESTVASYVLDALRAEKLPFAQERLAALHSYLPQVAKDRYRRFLERAGVEIG